MLSGWRLLVRRDVTARRLLCLSAAHAAQQVKIIRRSLKSNALQSSAATKPDGISVSLTTKPRLKNAKLSAATENPINATDPTTQSDNPYGVKRAEWLNSRSQGPLNTSRPPVSAGVLARYRREVLMTPAYLNRVVLTRKAWSEVSESTATVLTRLGATSETGNGRMGAELASVSHQELVQLLSEVVNHPLPRATGPALLASLEAECCARVNLFDSASLLFLADIFHLLSLHAWGGSGVTEGRGREGRGQDGGGEKTGERYLAAVFKAFDYRWDSLVSDRQTVVQLCYLLASSPRRTCTLHLMHRIEAFLSPLPRGALGQSPAFQGGAACFSAPELSLVCLAFFATNTALRSYEVLEGIAGVLERDLGSLKAPRTPVRVPRKTPSKPDLGIAAGILRTSVNFKLASRGLINNKLEANLSGSSHALKLHQVGSLLKALRHAQYSSEGFYQRLGDTILSLVDGPSNEIAGFDVTLNDLSNIAFTYASLRISHASLFNWISRAVLMVRAPMTPPKTPLKTSQASLLDPRAPRMKDLARLVWSLSALSIPVPTTLTRALLDSLRANPAIISSYPQAAVEALVGLAMGGIYPPDLYRRIFEPQLLAVKTARPLEQEHQMRWLRGVAQIEGGLDFPLKEGVKMPQSQVAMFRLPQFQEKIRAPQCKDDLKLLQNEKEVNLPQLQGELKLPQHQNRLNLLDVEKMYEFLPLLSDEMWMGDLGYELATRQGLRATIDSLRRVLGAPSYIRAHFVLPQSRITDIEIRVDASSRRPIAFHDGTSLTSILSMNTSETSRLLLNEDRALILCDNSVNVSEFGSPEPPGMRKVMGDNLSVAGGRKKCAQSPSSSPMEMQRTTSNSLYSKKPEKVASNSHDPSANVKNGAFSPPGVPENVQMDAMSSACSSENVQKVSPSPPGPSPSPLGPSPSPLGSSPSPLSPSAGVQRVLIKVFGFNQYSRCGSVLLGVPRMELRLLTRLGYEVYTLQPTQARSIDVMGGQGERDDFIRGFLLGTCNVKLIGTS